MVVTIWIDADALPSILKDYIIKTARQRSVPTCFVSNKALAVPNHPLFQAIQVEQGADVADAYIIEQSHAGDLAVTQDIPLADALVSKGLWVINLKGEAFTTSNMKQRLGVRDLMSDLRSVGIQTKGPKPFDERQKQAFINGFDKALTQCLKSQR
jgi:uncharacterized protein YaiI (UPF0178 family)